MRTTRLLVHVVGVDDFAFLAFQPPRKRFLLVSTLPFEKILHEELLILVPSHFEWFLININQVVNLLIVNLQEGNVHSETEPWGTCLLLFEHPEQVFDTAGNQSLFLIILPFDCVRFTRTRLSICKNGGMKPFNNPVDQAIHVDGVVYFLLCGVISDDSIKLEDFLTFLC